MAKGAILLLGSALAHWNPTVGDWVKENSDAILGIVGILAISFRSSTSQPIDWSNWTIAGIGLKF